MNKDKLRTKIRKHIILRIIRNLPILFLITLISSPFILIWCSWGLALKVGLTGLMGLIIFHYVDVLLEKEIEKAIDKYEFDKTTGNFKERLEQILKENNSKRNFTT